MLGPKSPRLGLEWTSRGPSWNYVISAIKCRPYHYSGQNLSQNTPCDHALTKPDRAGQYPACRVLCAVPHRRWTGHCIKSASLRGSPDRRCERQLCGLGSRVMEAPVCLLAMLLVGCVRALDVEELGATARANVSVYQDLQPGAGACPAQHCAPPSSYEEISV